MLHLLALFSCQPESVAATPRTPPPTPIPEVDEAEPVVRVEIPAGQAIVRECFGGSRDEMKRKSASNKSYPSSPMPPPAASPVVTATPAPSQPMGGVATTTGVGGKGGGGTGSASGRAGEGGPGYAPTTIEVFQGGSGGDSGAVASPKPAKKDSAPADKAPERPREQASAADEVALAEPEMATEKSELGRFQEEERASVGWGDTIYLSNDDSMSLASAQRLLWAVQNRGGVKTSDVRPHEFLNYFSFETDPVKKGDVFSVKGSAVKTAGDTLTMAFAVKGVVPSRKPLDLTMVLDRSGSMSAEGRMDYLKRGLMKMTESLKTGDRVDLVLFDDTLCTPLEDFVVGRDDPSILTGIIGRLAPKGATDVDLGLKEGYRIANARTDGKGRNRRMMLISDALLNTGDIDPNTVTEVAKAYEKDGIRMTAIGVGRDFNDKVLDMLTEKGKGAYVYLGSEAVVDRVFGIGFDSLTRTIAHDVRFALDLPPSLAMERFYGEESSTNAEDVQPIHYYAGTTQLFLQDLKVKSLVTADPVTLKIEYRHPDTGEAESQTYKTTVGALVDSDPRNIHKGRALMAWTDLILEKSMGGQPCGAPFSTWTERVSELGPDAEISWLDGLTSPLCGKEPVSTYKPVAKGVPYKVKVDSDLPIAEVTLACSGWKGTESISGSDSVARFASVTPGSCTLTLAGNVPMSSAVEVPSTGGDIRCMVRGGRVNCG